MERLALAWGSSVVLRSEATKAGQVSMCCFTSEAVGISRLM
jgi:hypothetical protein